MLINARVALSLALVFGAGAVSANEGGSASWEREPENEVSNLPSLQRGARNFMAYCSGCHSLKFERYSRLCEDLKITGEQCDALLVRPGDKRTDYIKSSMPEKDAVEWFGKAPPDLSLVARSRGPNWIFNFLTTFHADTSSQKTGVNNLQLPGTAMPHVLASLQGVQNAVWVNEENRGEDGKPVVTRVFKTFEPGVVGSLTPQQYDEFVRDTVNFLDYVSEPIRAKRESLGLWVVLFLIVFTWLTWLLKKEYWKDVH